LRHVTFAIVRNAGLRVKRSSGRVRGKYPLENYPITSVTAQSRSSSHEGGKKETASRGERKKRGENPRKENPVKTVLFTDRLILSIPSVSFRFLRPPPAGRCPLLPSRDVCSCGLSGLFTTRASKRTSPGAGDGKSDITPANASARCYVFLTCTGENRDLAAQLRRVTTRQPTGHRRVRCGSQEANFLLSFSPYIRSRLPQSTYTRVHITRVCMCGIIAPFAAGATQRHEPRTTENSI